MLPKSWMDQAQHTKWVNVYKSSSHYDSVYVDSKMHDSKELAKEFIRDDLYLDTVQITFDI
jgi:hypothetical protein